MFLLANSFATVANSLLESVGALGVIRAVARSIERVGPCGVKVAEASATLLAMPTTSSRSRCNVAVGHGPARVADHDRGHQRGGRHPGDSQPQPGAIVVGAHGDAVAAVQHEVDDHALHDQQAQHRAQRDPPQRPGQRHADVDQRGDGRQRARGRRKPAPATGSSSDRLQPRDQQLAVDVGDAEPQVPAHGLRLSVPAFWLTEVATTSTVSVRDATVDSSGCGGAASAPGGAWYSDSMETESTWPVVWDCSLHQLLERLDGRLEVGVELTDRAVVQLRMLASTVPVFMLIRTWSSRPRPAGPRSGTLRSSLSLRWPDQITTARTTAATAMTPSTADAMPSR